MRQPLRNVVRAAGSTVLTCAMLLTFFATAANSAPTRLDRTSEAAVGDALPPGWQARG